MGTAPKTGPTGPPWKPSLRSVGMLLAAAGIALVGTVIGWRLAGPTESETALGRVSFEVAPDLTGGIDAFVPIADWGLRADAFDAPFELQVEVRAVDRRGALAAASDSTAALGDSTAALGELEADLERDARGAVVRAFAVGLVVVCVIAVLAWLASPRLRAMKLAAYVSAILAVGGGGGSLALAAVTFDSRAFSDTSYYGRGKELAQLLEFFERQRDNERYTSTFENALGNFSAYLSEAPRTGEEGGATLLFGSDLHNNAPILSTLRRFAENEPVLLAGDFGHEGNEAEARLIAPRIAALGSQVVAVSGNHDSRGLMRALAAEGVKVLEQDGRLRRDGRVAGSPLLRVGVFTVAGFPDPLEWQGEDPDSPRRVFSFPELGDGELREDEAKAELVTWFEALPRAPDIVLVHQNALAQHLASELAGAGYERPLAIVTGHNHYPHVDRHGPITVVNAGTLGAGGILRVGQEPAGLGLMHLQRESARVQSVDLIRVEPLSGQAQADRVVIDVVCPPQEVEEGPCHYEPDGL